MTSDSAAGNDTSLSQPPEPLRSAVLAHQAGDLQKAYPLYRQFVADNPKNPTALQLFGVLLSQMQQYEPAIGLMRESLKLAPEQPEVANNLGNALLRAGNVDDAISSYRNAVRLRPGYADAQRGLAQCYMRTGQLDDALRTIEQTVQVHPQDAAAWMVFGNIRRARNEIDLAITAFEQALELRPDLAEAHHNLGVCLRLRHRSDEALQHYDAAQKLGIDGAALHHNRGNAYVDLQEPDQAIDAYRNALQKNAADLDTHRNLNMLLWQQGYVDDYLASYRDVLEANPRAEKFRSAYATALIQTGDCEKAEQVLRDGLQLSAEFSELKSLLAWSLEEQGRWEDALRMHTSAIATPDSVPNQLISYGRALLACGRPDDALKQIKPAAAAMPHNQRALAYLGLCWRLLDDERDAVLNDYDNMVRVYDVPVPGNYADTAEFNAALKKALSPLHFARTHPAEQTLRGGSQTSGNLFDRGEPEIQALLESLQHCIADYLARMPANSEHPLYSRRTGEYAIPASWSVLLQRDGFHTMHTHPLGWISSAYYVDVPKEIVDTDEYGGGLKFGEPDIDIGEKGAARRRIQPAVGKLALFPSYMWHGTVPFATDDPRLTVAFDVVPV